MKEIFAYRLQAARKLAGLSLQALADKMQGIVSKQAISKYENAKSLPDSNVLSALCEALNLEPVYFFRESQVQLSNVEFRKKSKLSTKKENQIKEMIKEFLERYLELENILLLESDFINPLENPVINSLDDIENASLELREKWNLGLNPIPNIMEMLEERGIKIFELDTFPEFDGLSAKVGDLPVIVVNKNFDIVRKRFTLVHELGHLLLSFKNNSNHEKLCHAFAGAFLIPKSKFIAEFGNKRNNISLEELIAVKEYFGISVQALMYRAKLLGVISERKYTSFCIYINQKGLRDETKLGEYIGEEESKRFHQLLNHAVSEEIISLGRAAELGKIGIDQFRQQNYISA